MSKMIERVARALWSKAKEEPVRRSVGVSFENDPLKPWWIDQARAAIEAMRAPTEAMVTDAYFNAEHTLEEVWGSPSPEQGCKNIYTAMIDAALKEKP